MTPEGDIWIGEDPFQMSEWRLVWGDARVHTARTHHTTITVKDEPSWRCRECPDRGRGWFLVYRDEALGLPPPEPPRKYLITREDSEAAKKRAEELVTEHFGPARYIPPTEDWTGGHFAVSPDLHHLEVPRTPWWRRVSGWFEGPSLISAALAFAIGAGIMFAVLKLGGVL